MTLPPKKLVPAAADSTRILKPSIITPVLMFFRLKRFSGMLLATFCCAGAATAENDLRSQIDHFIQHRWESESIEPASPCSDSDFVRRVYLDVVGRIPTVTEAETFLADGNPARREALVDLLLTSEDHVQHFADLFDTLMMGRTDEGKYKQRLNSGWRSYLENVFRANRPWNAVAAEILLARPEDKDQRGAVWFLYERNDQYQAIAEAVAPAFFGVRIECAQCHDHMIVDEIKQAHYWGLVAFFNRGKNTKTNQGLRVAESAVGGFSEFANLEGNSTPNLLTFLGAETVVEPRPADDQKQNDADDLYVEASQKNADRVPKFSRRQRFVDDVLRDHPLLARAMVNRLWAIMLGRGIVHPFDEMDSAHEPSHPELLDLLAEEFVRSNYNIRSMVRLLALTRAYQLESSRPKSVNDPATFAWYLERPLTAEQLSRSIQLVVQGRFANDSELTKQFRQQFKDVLPDEIVVGVNDTLFLSNGSAIDNFLNQGLSKDGLLQRVRQLQPLEQRVPPLFQAAYGRAPSDDESAAVVSYLSTRIDCPDDALRQVLWSLLTSAEFHLNH